MIYKETYRGRAIYWHGEQGYGCELHAIAPTIRECRDRIDALESELELARRASQSPADAFWESMPPKDRASFRRAYASDPHREQYDTVADYAYATRTKQR